MQAVHNVDPVGYIALDNIQALDLSKHFRSYAYALTTDIIVKERAEYTPSRLLQARATCNTLNP